MADTVVDVLRAVLPLEAGRAGAGVGCIQIHARGAVLTRVEALATELNLLLAVLACIRRNRTWLSLG